MAAFAEGRHAQAFPSFGSERMGAPVVSFCRIDDRPIRTREPVMEPDALVIQDVTLLHQVDLFAGLSADGYVLVNTSQSFDELGLGEFVRRFHRDRLLTCPATELALEQLGRPLPNAALLGGFAALTGQITLEAIAAAIRERFAGAIGRAQRRRGDRRLPTRQLTKKRSSPVLRQIEGSRAVAETVARCRPEVVCAYPISPQTHIIEAIGAMVKSGELAPCEFINVESEFAAMSVSIGASADGRAGLHGDREPGAAVHDRGRLQRGGTRTADRDDAREPGDRRADQHLERPQRRDGRPRLRLDPALRRDEPGGRRPPRPGVPPRRGALAPGHGLHGRLHPHPRRRRRRRARAGRRRRLPPRLRAAPGARPGRPGLDRSDGRPGGLRGGPLPRAPPPARRARADPRPRRGVRRRPSGARAVASSTRYRTEDAETIVVALGSVLGTIKDAVDRRRDAGERVGVVGITSFRPFPLEAVRARPARAPRGSSSSRRPSASASAACSRPTSRWRPTTRSSRCAPSSPGSAGGRSRSARSKRCSPTRRHDRLEPLTFLDLDHEHRRRVSAARMAATRRSGPSAENVLRDLGAVASRIG